jgi:hypothetical protein
MMEGHRLKEVEAVDTRQAEVMRLRRVDTAGTGDMEVLRMRRLPPWEAIHSRAGAVSLREDRRVMHRKTSQAWVLPAVIR